MMIVYLFIYLKKTASALVRQADNSPIKSDSSSSSESCDTDPSPVKKKVTKKVNKKDAGAPLKKRGPKPKKNI